MRCARTILDAILHTSPRPHSYAISTECTSTYFTHARGVTAQVALALGVPSFSKASRPSSAVAAILDALAAPGRRVTRASTAAAAFRLAPASRREDPPPPDDGLGELHTLLCNDEQLLNRFANDYFSDLDSF